MMYGIVVYYRNATQCKAAAPAMTYTMLTTLIFGSIQLVMFAILAAGITWWAICKCIGKPVSFTPQSLWEDHQQMID